MSPHLDTETHEPHAPHEPHEPHNEPHSHRCLHDQLKRAAPTAITPQQYSVPLTSRATRGRKLAVSHEYPLDTKFDAHRQPLRIHVDTSHVDADPGRSCFSSSDTVIANEWGKKRQCGYSDVITAQKRLDLEQKVVPAAVDFISRALKVHRVDGPLRLSSVACGYEGGVEVPEWMRSEGLPDADFVVFVTMRPIESPDTMAYGGHCETDQTGRPIAAHFNWAPMQLPRADTDFMVQYLARIAMHELTHALVFTPELISHFPADATPPPSAEHGLGWNWDNGYYGTGISYLTVNAGMRAHVSTPRVARAAQRHFGCPTLRGAQLEDGGGAGTATSHWEMRAFRDEYMVGSSAPSFRAFSVMTAALFADSGWYGVDESLVEPLSWGHHAGCAFVEEPCTEWDRPGYLCSRSGELSCNYDRRSQAYCEVHSYGATEIPVSQRYFGPDSPRGGFSPLLDYCPVYRAYSNGDCTRKGAVYDWLPNNGQERCENCRCFDTANFPSSTWGPEPGCFRMRCLNASQLEIKVGDVWHRCEPGGGVIRLSPYNDGSGGAITCPPASELCDLDTELWPQLSSIEPKQGPASGGLALTLRGAHLDKLHPPVQLLFATAEGVETAARDLRIVNSTFATATIPALLGATSHAGADVTLTDEAGRTAYLFDAFHYDPGWGAYATTFAIFGVLVLLSCVVLPAAVRQGCKGTAALREKVVWRTLNPTALEATKATAEQGTAGAVGVAALAAGARVANAVGGAVRTTLRAVGIGEQQATGGRGAATQAVAPEMV